MIWGGLFFMAAHAPLFALLLANSRWGFGTAPGLFGLGHWISFLLEAFCWALVKDSNAGAFEQRIQIERDHAARSNMHFEEWPPGDLCLSEAGPGVVERLPLAPESLSGFCDTCSSAVAVRCECYPRKAFV